MERHYLTLEYLELRNLAYAGTTYGIRDYGLHVNDYGKTLQLPLTDDIVVLDGHVGDRVNDTSVNTDKEYKVVHIGDILGYIK